MKKTTVAPDLMTPQTGAPVMSAAMMPATTRPPLWLQVARWCLGCKIPVNRQLIAQASRSARRRTSCSTSPDDAPMWCRPGAGWR